MPAIVSAQLTNKCHKVDADLEKSSTKIPVNANVNQYQDAESRNGTVIAAHVYVQLKCQQVDAKTVKFGVMKNVNVYVQILEEIARVHKNTYWMDANVDVQPSNLKKRQNVQQLKYGVTKHAAVNVHLLQFLVAVIKFGARIHANAYVLVLQLHVIPTRDSTAQVVNVFAYLTYNAFKHKFGIQTAVPAFVQKKNQCQLVDVLPIRNGIHVCANVDAQMLDQIAMKDKPTILTLAHVDVELISHHVQAINNTTGITVNVNVQVE